MVNNNTYQKMFYWLFLGLVLTFVIGYALSLNEALALKVLAIGVIPIIITELVIALLMGIRIRKMHPITARICYCLFCITTGITFSTIFMTYSLNSLMSIFLISGIIFGCLALYGYKTNKDLGRFGTILLVTLLIIIIFSILNFLIFKSSGVELGLSALGVLIFCGYIAYDMQKVKMLIPTIGEDKAAIYGAFELYLDFINLFIRLLELFGKRDD